MTELRVHAGCSLAGALPEGTQGHFRSILTDEHLRVMGSEGTIYAMGDGATIYQVSITVAHTLPLPCSRHTQSGRRQSLGLGCHDD